MVEIKLYLYDGTRYENKGTDYSQYVLSGSNWTDDLTEVLDTAEVTLVGLPTSDEFAPTTKFIMEIREVDAEQGTNQLYQTLSLCVANDTVTQPILSDNNYFSHSITFNEASVIAQGRVVDNCSETFELKKVDINSESTYDTTANAQPTIAPSYTNDEVKSNYTRTGRRAWNVHETFIIKQKYEWVFTSDYLSQSDPNYGSQNDWDTFKKYQSVNGTLNVSLPIPLLSVKFGVKGSTSYQSNRNLCSVETRVYYSADEGTTWQLDTSVGVNGVLTTKPSTTVPEENAWESDWLFKQVYGSSLQGYGMTRIKAMTGAINEYYRKYTDYDSSVQNRFVNFTVVPNYQYKVIISPRIIPTATLELGDHSDPDLENTKYFYGDTEQMLYTYSYAYLNSALSISLASYTYIANNTNTPITFSSTTSNEGRPSMVMDFSTFVEGTNLSVFLKSAPAISVYDMIKDIILKTQMTFKEEGIYIKDTPTLFDFDENDLNILQNTEIIESSFNQKNLWEVLLEAGKYIHAIPYLEFGYDMKIIIKWRYLGKPDKFENNSHAMSIFNSKSIENYVGALNSYVTNMVQRGGYIEEYVAPKSESEDYLVYNDVAVIKTTKPIIELLSLGFRCVRNGSGYTASSTIYDITNRIYEKNVYELFDVVASTIPNKGLAVYYNLGENVIRGLNYQLPSVNTGSGETEYSIKRIIGTALGMSASNFMNIKINDFVFYVKYRTKETIRSEQSRPDLRKFLKNINYENIPYHNQFNNQQDKMVDSIKFGNQTYGKLIRTGNTEYQTTEWNDRLGDLKQSGQLIDNRGDIYYVSKAVHTFYQDYIISDVTYSKDYNQLSEIVGIPSEPRFFEISEQSNIDRHISINGYLWLGTSYPQGISSIVDRYGGIQYFKDLLFGNKTYPKYALTQFKNDKDNPDSLIGLAQFNKEFIHPISAYSMRNTLTFKWEMRDNFSAGDSVEDTTVANPVDTAYSKLVPQQYTDKYGRADLLDFLIIEDIDSALLTRDNIKAFPKCPYRFYPNENLAQFTDFGTNAGVQYFPSLYYTINRNDWDYLEVSPSMGSIDIYTGDFYIYDSVNDEYISVTNDRLDILNGYFVYYDGTRYYLFCHIETDALTDYMTYEKVFTSKNYQDIVDFIAKPYVGAFARNNKVVCSSNDVYYGFFGTHSHGLALIKDNRERIIINTNIQMLTDSDRFVLSGYMWQQNKGTVKLALLNQEVNKIINNTIPNTSIIRDNAGNEQIFNISYTLQNFNQRILIDITNALSSVQDLSEVKALALITDGHPTVGANLENYFVIARNVSDLTDAEKRTNWRIESTDKMGKSQ